LSFGGEGLKVRKRERWATRIGLVLAMAGNAVGLGNFLRFPGQAAAHGGGAFMIPYFISFILMGIPLMWLEWAQGRFGGARGHGTTPGMFQAMWGHPVAKYLGVLGIFIPTVILVYYSYICSWTLGYSILSLFGLLPQVPPVPPGLSASEITAKVLKPFEEFRHFYVGKPSGDFIIPSAFAYGFFLFVLAINAWVLSRGVARGIEMLAKVAMPLLFFMAIVLAVRVLTLGEPVMPGQGPMEGLAFLWEPKWFVERGGRKIFVLFDAQTWLAAAGQIFFTLSLGMGAIQCYASYLGKDDDVMLTGLSTSTANEFAEVVLGASIAIPAAVTFFGVAFTQEIAEKGSFFLGFTSMPAIFSYMPAGRFFAFLWFFLLFLAGFTSTVAMAQPLIAFMEDEFGLRRERAVFWLVVLWFFGTHICIFVRDGWQVMDFWSGTFGPVLMALVETVVMMWIFGAERMWAEMHRGAELRAPRFFYYTTKYVTPALLLGIFVGLAYQTLSGIRAGVKTLEGFSPGWPIWGTRAFLLLLFLGLCVATWYAFTRRREAA